MDDFINIVSLDGLLQQYKVIEDYIKRDLNYLKVIREEKPNLKNWIENISYNGNRYPRRNIGRDQCFMLRNIEQNSDDMKIIGKKIEEKCKLLCLDYGKIIKGKKIPIVERLKHLSEYKEFLGEPVLKRKCSDAFGKKYSGSKLQYYS